MIIAIVAGALVVLGGIGVVLLLVLRGGSSGPEPIEPTEPAAAPEEPAAEAVIPEAYDGFWEGSFEQYDSEFEEIGGEQNTYIELVGGGNTGMGELYEGTSLLCSWELTLVEDLGEEGLEFDLYAVDEDISCVTNSTVFLIPSGEDTLELFWQGTMSNGEESTGIGVLTREN